jgi:5-deoxy-glucuronate isomerase
VAEIKARPAGCERQLHFRAGQLSSERFALDLTPERAGWAYAMLRVVELPPGGALELATGAAEWLLLSLAGAADVACGEARATLRGRTDVFGGPSDCCYLPPFTSVRVASRGGGRFALAGARAATGAPFAYRDAASATVELRGAGACSRRVVNYAMDDSLPAERLLCCEVVTPAGNWSSFPPHKHDERRDGEAELEEIYYFEVAPDPSGRRGVAYQRLYGTPERPIDLLAEVGHGDVVLIPHGYHGPSMAVPGYDLYYLNVMAGPGERRWLACDDPAYHWVRASWERQAVDARLLGGGEARA